MDEHITPQKLSKPQRLDPQDPTVPSAITHLGHVDSLLAAGDVRRATALARHAVEDYLNRRPQMAVDEAAKHMERTLDFLGLGVHYAKSPVVLTMLENARANLLQGLLRLDLVAPGVAESAKYETFRDRELSEFPFELCVPGDVLALKIELHNPVKGNLSRELFFDVREGNDPREDMKGAIEAMDLWRADRKAEGFLLVDIRVHRSDR